MLVPRFGGRVKQCLDFSGKTAVSRQSILCLSWICVWTKNHSFSGQDFCICKVSHTGWPPVSPMSSVPTQEDLCNLSVTLDTQSAVSAQETELTFARQPPFSYKSHTFSMPFERVALLSGHSLTCPLVFPRLLTLGQLQRLISRGRGRSPSLGLGISVLPKTGTIPLMRKCGSGNSNFLALALFQVPQSSKNLILSIFDAQALRRHSEPWKMSNTLWALILE